MKEQYPYPIPESIAEKLEEGDVLAALCHNYAPGYGLMKTPLAVQCFEGWGLVFFPLLDVLEDCARDDQQDSEKIYAMFRATKSLAGDFDRILNLLAKTFPYDPVVRRRVAETSPEWQTLTEEDSQDHNDESTAAHETDQAVPPLN